MPACIQSGLTPLHIGAFVGSADVVAELLRQGCDVTAMTSRGETALHFGVRSGQPRIAQLVLDSSAGANVDAATFNVRRPPCLQLTLHAAA